MTDFAFVAGGFAAAPEMNMQEVQKSGFIPACPPAAQELCTRIWTDLQKWR